MKLFLSTLPLAGLVALSCASVVQAQELVVNGGFETGNLAPWTVDNTNRNIVSSDPNYAHTGTFGLFYAAVGVDSPLSQTLTTTPGAIETISFWQHQLDGTPNEVTLDFGGNRLLTLTNLVQGPWTQYSVTTTATSTSTILRFGLRQDPGSSAIDDISVFQGSRVAATPEPGTWAMCVGMAASGGFLLKRRKRTIR